MVTATPPKIAAHDFSVTFGGVQALRGITLDIQPHEILGIIGPANSGKTSFLRALNRTNDFHPTYRHTGTMHLDGEEIHAMHDVAGLRRRVGMVFALPVPLPQSFFDNVIYGPKLHQRLSRSEAEGLVERSLTAASLWDEVKDRLEISAMKLSGGQQQRLCIARTLAMEPEVILFDEPSSGLDPISTAKVEETMTALKAHYTIVLVTNNTKQAARVSDRVAFFLGGELIELDRTDALFTAPRDRRTEDYLTGRFG